MTDFDERMAALRARFLAKAAEERVALAAALAAADWDEARRRAHILAGSAAIFGHPEIGLAAGAAEDAIDAAADRAEIERLVAGLIDRLDAVA